MKSIIIFILSVSYAFAGAKNWKTEQAVSDSEIKKRLTPLQYKVTQEDGTEKPFKNKYWNNTKAGIYVDIVSGEPLFSSKDKFKSGTGWPSFIRPISKKTMVEKLDFKLVWPRKELRSKYGDSHLGHVFDDGPAPTGKRYCINSASLRFVPVDKLKEEGYAEYAKDFLKEKVMKSAYLAGGCFWGMEKYLRDLNGVVDTEVGYIGGEDSTANYDQVKNGMTGHAEAIRVSYDESKLSFEALVRFFFRIHNPTTKNQQGNDKGTQYRSAIFTNDESEKRTIKELVKKIDNSDTFSDPVVTTIEGFTKFTDAEDYHQDYLKKNPNGYNCHLIRPDFKF